MTKPKGEAPKNPEEELEIDDSAIKNPPKVEEPPHDEPDPLAELRAQLDQERAARVSAEQRANEASQQAYQARSEAGDSQMNVVIGALERVKEMQGNLKEAFKAAIAADDTDAQAEIQIEISNNAARLLQLENGLESMKQQPKPAPPRMIQSDPVESFAAQLTPRAASWIRRHPECVTDQKLFQKMVAAHNIAVADDIELDSDEYFRTVEGLLFKKHKAPVQDDEEYEDPTAQAARRAPPPAAPVGRTSGNGRTAQLSPEEREIAENSGQTYEEYARNKQALKKEGRVH
jgi:hypothetical protein